MKGTYYWHTDGRPFLRGGTLSVGFDTRSDYGIGFSASHTKFNDQTDGPLYSLGIAKGVSNRFRQYGIVFTSGTQADRAYSFVGPAFSVRVFRHLDLAYAGAIQNIGAVKQQHIATLNYEVSPTRSFGGRVVVQGGDTNWYLSYRHSGIKGTEVFFILGDPNTRRFTEKVQANLVFAL